MPKFVSQAAKWVQTSENVGYIPNEIAIFHRDNDQQNHWGKWGTLFSDTPKSTSKSRSFGASSSPSAGTSQPSTPGRFGEMVAMVPQLRRSLGGKIRWIWFSWTYIQQISIITRSSPLSDSMNSESYHPYHPLKDHPDHPWSLADRHHYHYLVNHLHHVGLCLFRVWGVAEIPNRGRPNLLPGCKPRSRVLGRLFCATSFPLNMVLAVMTDPVIFGSEWVDDFDNFESCRKATGANTVPKCRTASVSLVLPCSTTFGSA